MKKIISLVFVSIFFLAGCGNKNTITCTGKMEDDSMDAKGTIVAKTENGKVVNATATFEFNDEESANEVCGLLTLMGSFETDESSKLDYKCTGKKVVLNDYLKYSTTMDEDAKTDYTKEEFIKAMEEQKLTCK